MRLRLGSWIWFGLRLGLNTVRARPRLGSLDAPYKVRGKVEFMVVVSVKVRVKWWVRVRAQPRLGSVDAPYKGKVRVTVRVRLRCWFRANYG